MSGADLLTWAMDQLAQTCDLLDRRLDSAMVAPTRRHISRARARVGRGADHTLVALQGGTGSGKSLLFNALAKMEYSEVSVIRPTTARATACVWGDHAGPLLEWLGIEPGASIQRDSVLEPDLEGWRGVVLVDLPDSDSTDPEHRAVADAVLPLADVLVWVTDPQKYADPGLLERFVPAVKENPGRENVLVLNQIDTVTRHDASALTRALGDLLEHAGLSDSLIIVTSALNGQGVDQLRAALFGQSAGCTAAVRWMADEVAGQAERLLHVAQLEAAEAEGPEPGLSAESPEHAADLAVTQLSEAMAGSQIDGWQVDLVRPDAAALTAVTASVVGLATRGWPKGWFQAACRAVATPAQLGAELDQALTAMPVPPRPGWFSRTFQKTKVREGWKLAWQQALRGALESVVEQTLVEPIRLVEHDRQAAGRTLRSVAANCRAICEGSMTAIPSRRQRGPTHLRG